MSKSFVVGVGMTKFLKPSNAQDYPDFAKQAMQRALRDAAVTPDQI